MITAPDPDARNSDRYRMDLAFRAAADEAHAMAMQFNETLQLLKVPCDFLPEDIDWQDDCSADATSGVADDY